MFNKMVINKDKRLTPLGQLAQPVKELYYISTSLDKLLDRPIIAVVGSRKVSPYGMAVTRQLAGDLAKAGVVIISGLALGVDSIAHQAALDVGGATIAVLPCGIDKVYPSSHTYLARKIIKQGGALISEYGAESSPPMKYQFIARNRIIASLSQGVLITEAAKKSGSLHTANFALEQGIDVFAVPGNITSSTSVGTNNLIKNGAIPTTSANDIFESLGITLTSESDQYKPVTKQESTILSLLRQEISDSDILLHMCGLTPGEYYSTLTSLEVNNVIMQPKPGHWAIVG